LGVPLLPADCAGRPCHLCGGPVDVFGDHAVSCKKSGFGDRHLGIQTVICKVLTLYRVPHDREVDIAGNGRRPADILLKAWDRRRDIVVDLTIVHSNPVTGRPLRGRAVTLLKTNGEEKCRESADSCGRIGVYFSPMVFDSWGGPPRRRKRGGEGDIYQMHRPAPAQRPPSGGKCPATGPRRETGPLGGPLARGPNDGDKGGAGMVGGRTPAHSRIHSGGKPAVVSHGPGIPPPPLTHCAGTASAESPIPRISNTYVPFVPTFFLHTI